MGNSIFMSSCTPFCGCRCRNAHEYRISTLCTVFFSTDRKLLGEDLSAEDLRHLHPAVYTNLTKLRTFSGNFEDLGLVFQVRPWLL